MTGIFYSYIVMVISFNHFIFSYRFHKRFKIGKNFAILYRFAIKILGKISAELLLTFFKPKSKLHVNKDK